jgi:hypothetical protein
MYKLDENRLRKAAVELLDLFSKIDTKSVDAQIREIYINAVINVIKSASIKQKSTNIQVDNIPLHELKTRKNDHEDCDDIPVAPLG